MKSRSDFSQFRATPVTFQEAFRLVGADLMHQLKIGRSTEVLLDTGAKLFFYEGQFHIFSYASDGRDGWNAYRMLYPILQECTSEDFGYTCGEGHIDCAETDQGECGSWGIPLPDDWTPEWAKN